jgi:2-polyprenyl-3-methyl-5-hydroxy-6-metoxy-1,4-benzoquinol methylase
LLQSLADERKIIIRRREGTHPKEKYDAIVTYGVIEHLPNYRKLFERAWECLKLPMSCNNSNVGQGRESNLL